MITCTRLVDLINTTDSVYYDGFGMPVQKFNTVASRNSVANVSCYDALDRPVRQYLPLPVANSNYIGTGLENLVKSHYNDQRPFSETLYRGIAGDQPVEIIKEGANMLAHSNKLEYICNNQTDAMLCCRKYKLTTTTTANGREAVEEVTLTGNYSGGMLDVVRSTDADGCTLLTFTDWRGFKILERRVVDEPAGTFADTYFLYDLLGQLRVILQPEGSAQMDRAYRSWKLDFAFNASLASVNVAKVIRAEYYPTLSIGLLKSYLSDIWMLKRFFAASGISPNKTLNIKLVKELFGLVADAA